MFVNLLRCFARWMIRSRIASALFREYRYWDADPSLSREEIRQEAVRHEEALFRSTFGQT